MRFNPGRVRVVTPSCRAIGKSNSKLRLNAGARPEDGVCTLRGKDVVRILETEFGVKYTLGGAYDLLWRLGYSCLDAATAA